MEGGDAWSLLFPYALPIPQSLPYLPYLLSYTPTYPRLLGLSIDLYPKRSR